LLYVVHERDVAVFVGAVDEGEFDRGAGVAAVEDHKEGRGGVEAGHEVPMEGVAVELALLLKVDRDDGVVEAGGAVAVGVFDLAAVPGVVLIYVSYNFGLFWNKRRARVLRRKQQALGSLTSHCEES